MSFNVKDEGEGADNLELEESKEDDFDVEEAKDAVIGTLGPRQKSNSDVTGMSWSRPPRPARQDRRTVSDIVLMMNLPEGARHQRVRQKSSNVTVFRSNENAFFQADLRMAEAIQEQGTLRERREKRVSEEQLEKVFEDKEGFDVPDDFVFNHTGFTSEEAAELLVKYGKNELPDKTTPKWLIFIRLFYAPMPIMIWIAIIIEAAILNFIDMCILLFIQFANAGISFYETTKAGDAVAALKSSLKPSATCKRDGKWAVTDATLIVPGDLVLLGSGSAIPADCRVNGGEIDVDQSALTGESLPVTFYKGDSCKMGSTVVRGEVEATVEFTGANTFFGKTASLLGETNETSHIQKILITIVAVLVVLSVTLCIINLVYLVTQGISFAEALSFTIVLLVASIPLAIEIVTTATLAIGSKKLSSHGAIVARLAAIEDLAGMSILCSDKTGTLTLNEMVLQDETPLYAEGETQESVLVWAAIAAKWKEPPRDALDRLTLGSVNMALLEHYEQLDYVPFDPTTKRTEGTVKDTRTGKEFKTSKGAPHIILRLLDPTDVDMRETVEKDVALLGERGIRSLAVAKTDDDGVWKMMGLLTFLDPPRPDTKQTVDDAVAYGISVKMITGDHLLIARNTALQLGMGDKIFTAERLPLLDEETKAKPDDLSKNYGDLCLVADGFAQVYPEHKYLIVECLREMGYTVGMTGDGVNDSPALKRADVGIAVAGSTDAARAAADIILTQPGLSTIIHGIIVAREIFQRINNFITYRIAATLQLLCFFFIAIFIFKPAEFQQPPEEYDAEPWPEFFHMPVLMLMLITVLNDGTLITIAYDNAQANTTPDRWNLPVTFSISSTLGAVSCLSSLLLLWFLLDSWNPNGFIQKVGMQGVQYGQVTTAIYLKVSVSDFLTLFSARTGRRWFWQIAPAPILLGGGCFALTLSSLLSLFWPYSHPDHIETEGLVTAPGMFGFVWIFSLFFWFIQDACKVLLFKWMLKRNFRGISTTGVVVLPDSAKKLIEELDKALADDDDVDNGKH